jgi:ABC-type Na+ efflux pump permease subunit
LLEEENSSEEDETGKTINNDVIKEENENNDENKENIEKPENNDEKTEINIENKEKIENLENKISENEKDGSSSALSLPININEPNSEVSNLPKEGKSKNSIFSFLFLFFYFFIFYLINAIFNNRRKRRK